MDNHICKSKLVKCNGVIHTYQCEICGRFLYRPCDCAVLEKAKGERN
jgi:hypothetical protein